MKKYIVATLFALISLSGITQNTWSSLGNNDFVSRLALQDAIANGIFAGQGVTLSTGDFVQKGQATSYCWCNSISGTSTDFATKIQFVTSLGSNYTIYGQNQFSSGHIYGYSSNTNACAGGTTSYYIPMYYTGTLATNSPVNFTTTTSAYGYNPYGHTSPYSYYYYSGGWLRLGYDGSAGYSILTMGSCSGSLTNVYIAVSYFASGSRVSTIVTSYSDAGNTSTLNVNTNVTITVKFEDAYGNTWDVNTPVITNGTHTVTFNSGLSPSAYPPISAYVLNVSPTTSSTQQYIPN